jgi:hypothetical protein
MDELRGRFPDLTLERATEMWLLARRHLASSDESRLNIFLRATGWLRAMFLADWEGVEDPMLKDKAFRDFRNTLAMIDDRKARRSTV